MNVATDLTARRPDETTAWASHAARANNLVNPSQRNSLHPPNNTIDKNKLNVQPTPQNDNIRQYSALGAQHSTLNTNHSTHNTQPPRYAPLLPPFPFNVSPPPPLPPPSSLSLPRPPRSLMATQTATLHIATTTGYQKPQPPLPLQPATKLATTKHHPPLLPPSPTNRHHNTTKTRLLAAASSRTLAHQSP